MATFKEIRGQTIKSLSTDPSPLVKGQIWYNSTSSTLKCATPVSASWAAGGAYPTPTQGLFGGGTQTAGWAAGGFTPTISANTNEYNGSSWTTTPASFSPPGRAGGGSAGTQTSALAFGGTVAGPRVGTTNEYDGAAWTVGGTMGTGRDSIGGCGTQTAGLASGGFISGPYPSGSTTAVEEYNGASWTAGTALPGTAGKADISACGTQTTALTAGGGPVTTAVAQTYNGTSWTTITSLPLARQAGRMTGDSTNGLYISGAPAPAPTAVNEWTGLAWAADAAIVTGRWAGMVGGGRSDAILSAGFDGSSALTTTEEYTATGVGIKTITTS